MVEGERETYRRIEKRAEVNGGVRSRDRTANLEEISVAVNQERIPS